jgi:hypothetical protein
MGDVREAATANRGSAANMNASIDLLSRAISDLAGSVSRFHVGD